MKSKQIGRGSSRGRHDGFSPVIAALVALEGLAFIALGAATQTELHLTVLDLVISVAAIATVLGTAGLAMRRTAARTEFTRQMDSLELEEVLHRTTIHAKQYGQIDEELRRARADAVALVNGVAARDEPAAVAPAEEVARDPFDWTQALRAEAEALAAQRPEPPPLEKEAGRPGEALPPARPSAGVEPQVAAIEEETVTEPETVAKGGSAPMAAAPSPRPRMRRTSRPSAVRRRGRRLVREGARRGVPADASGADEPDPLRRALTLITPGAAPMAEGPELLLRLNLDGDTLAALLRLVEQGANVQSVQPKLVTLPGGKLDAQPS